MPKADSKRLNIRLKTEASTMLETLTERWDGCSQTAAMERSIAQAHDGIRALLPDEAVMMIKWWARQDGVDDVTVIARALAVYDASRAESTDEAIEELVGDIPPGSPRCVHCGRRYVGSKRPPFICRACLNGGHVAGLPEDCQECQRGTSA